MDLRADILRDIVLCDVRTCTLKRLYIYLNRAKYNKI